MSSSTLSDGGDSERRDALRETSPHSGETQAETSAGLRLHRVDETLAAGLYIVSTPIGNLRDISLRALDVLASVDLVLAEDTRVARKLLTAYGLNPQLRAYHDHNAAKTRPGVIDSLKNGSRIALISDAGTPLVSDPGFKLARDAIEAGSDVVAIPGASAPLAALAISGLPSDRFLFGGFLSPKPGARRKTLNSLKLVPATLIFFEGPSRLADSLADMLDILGDRPAVIARELTKKFEEARRGPLSELASAVAEDGPPRGEIVILIGPPIEGQDVSPQELDEAIRAAIKKMPVKQAAAEIAARYGLQRREVYNRALDLKDE